MLKFTIFLKETQVFLKKHKNFLKKLKNFWKKLTLQESWLAGGFQKTAPKKACFYALFFLGLFTIYFIFMHETT